MTELLKSKVIIPLHECRAGMKLMQPIIDSITGNIIVAKDQILTEDSIKKLENFPITEVWIALSSETKIWQATPEKIKRYEEYSYMLRHTMGSYSEEIIKIEMLFEIAKSIIKDFQCSLELLSCVNLVKDTQEDIYTHSINVAFLSLLMGRWQGLKEEVLNQLVIGALLHDIGKLDMPTQIENKKLLNIKEKIQYRRHPIYSYERLNKYKELDNETLKGILTHHERCNGSGFPLNLREDRINNIGKILGLADEYDQLKPQYHMFKVIEKLRYIEVQQFDRSLVDKLCSNIANYYIGIHVLLTTGEVGVISLIDPSKLHRPLVKVGEKYIELSENPNINIEKIY